MVRITADIAGLERKAAALLAGAESETTAFVARAGATAAASARDTHPYTNRTGHLEASTQPVEAAGSALAGTLRGGFAATMFYASFVNQRPAFEYMRRGYTLATAAIVADLRALPARIAAHAR